jgi:hypothetical protein
MSNPGDEKIRMLQGSVKCLIFGLLGLLPVIGLPCALAALWLSGRIRRSERLYWNAAKPYRVLGAACAATGAIGWFLVAVLIVFNAVLKG